MSASDNFYREFEDKYRGSRQEIVARLQAYSPFLAELAKMGGSTKAADLGCGRGEWLEVLSTHGFVALGVDLDEGMLAGCRERGLHVRQCDAFALLATLDNDSQAIVSAFHLIEHIPFESLKTLIDEALRVLQPGGLLILETPNPENIVVGTNNFYLDPTHQKPIPHQLLSFLTEYAGFKRTKVVRLQEPEGLSQKNAPSLLDVLEGVSPDYAIVAQKDAPQPNFARLDTAFDQSFGLSLSHLASKFDATKDVHIIEHLNSQLLESQKAIQSLAAGLSGVSRYLGDLENRINGIDSSLPQLLTHAKNLEIQMAELNARAADSDNRWLRLERSGLKGVLKYKVALPLVSFAAPIAFTLFRPFPSVRHHANLWLRHNLPQLQAHLEQNSASSQSKSEDGLNVGGRGGSGLFEKIRLPLDSDGVLTKSDPNALLSDPFFASLPRPLNIEACLEKLNRGTSNEAFESVTTLGQMKRSKASVCFVLTVDRHDSKMLSRSMQSVLRQTDPAWEIILCGDDDKQPLIAEWLDRDWRIRRLAEGGGLDEVQNLIRASTIASTVFAGSLALGDVVDDDLVKCINQKVAAESDLDVIYTDEACLAKLGADASSFFKPDWSPEHHHAVNLVGRFLAVRKALLLNLQVKATASKEADEYAFSLEVTSKARRIGHIEEVMYVRERDHATPPGGFFSPEALEPARSALQDHLAKHSPEVSVLSDKTLGSLRVKWPIPDGTEVTLLILTAMKERTLPGRGNTVLATNFVKSIIAKSTFKGYKIIVVDDGFVPDDLRELLAEHGHRTQTFPKDGEFSFAGKSNFATSLVNGGVALLLNDDLEVISEDWIESLVSHAIRPEVGVVGGKLLFPNNNIQHAGISTGLNGSAGHVFMNSPANQLEYGGYASVDRNCGAVTGAVMAYRKDFFEQMGGFDEFFRIDYNDIDFCLRCVEQGYRIVFTPHAKLYHFHNSSFQRQHDKSMERQEFLRRWQHLMARDPFYGLHLQSICAEQRHDPSAEASTEQHPAHAI